MEKTLNNVQLAELEELKEVTDEEFQNAMLKYTCFITSEQLDNLYHEAVELEESDEYFIQSIFDMNYHSVASNYGLLDSHSIAQLFGFYGDYNLYMDELGRGLVVEYY